MEAGSHSSEAASETGQATPVHPCPCEEDTTSLSLADPARNGHLICAYYIDALKDTTSTYQKLSRNCISCLELHSLEYKWSTSDQIDNLHISPIRIVNPSTV